jgi:hypothetical protein
MSKKCWSINPQQSRELLTWCLRSQKVDRMLVVVRMEQHATPRELEQGVRRLFGKNLLDDFNATAWPGTELIGHPAHVFVVKVDELIADLIVRTQPDLTKWLHAGNPPLPEDICLFASGADAPALVSVTHEKLFWVIAEQNPKLEGLRETTLRPDELFWQGKYFCRE